MTLFSTIQVKSGSSKGLPDVGISFNSVDIGLPRLWCRDIEKFLDGRFNDTIINPIEGRFSHFAIKFNQPLLAICNVPFVFCRNLFLNSWSSDIRKCIKYPFLNAVSWYEMNRRNLLAFLKSVGQFAYQFAGFDNIRCQPIGIRENIFDNDSYRISPTEAQYPPINPFRFTLKTIAYKS